MADRVWVDRRTARDIVTALREQNRLLETGGALFGYQADGQVIVTHAPGLQHGRRRPWSFEPDRDEVDALIGRMHARSDGTLRYVGSWHTHPGGSTRPSANDRRTAERMAAQDDLGLAEPLLLIVATHRLPWRAHIAATEVWQWSGELHGLRHRREDRVTVPWRTKSTG